VLSLAAAVIIACWTPSVGAAEVTFARDGSGKVVKAVHRQGGATLDAPRVA
jgi:hypothetical protein